ncbi:MAG: hypothetical protein IPO81_21520 [Kouleothrix sp.]|nr:hypothetical protein [Kouleothrix sp.]
MFILSYLKVAALQVAHGAMFRDVAVERQQVDHVLLPVLHQTLSDIGICRHATLWRYNNASPIWRPQRHR